MGDPRKTRKQYKRPLQIWNKENIEREKNLKQAYGLKNKKEIWKAETGLRKKRTSARNLLALQTEERAKRQNELLQSLARQGILDEKASLDDVLSLNIESFLERRLQTIVWRKGLANTASQARQFITHGHIAIGGKKVTAPSYMVKAEEEPKIGYYAGKKMTLRPPTKEKPGKKEEKQEPKEETTKEKFEKAKPEETKKEEKQEPKEEAKKPEEKPEKTAPREQKKPDEAKNQSQEKPEEPKAKKDEKVKQ